MKDTPFRLTPFLLSKYFIFGFTSVYYILASYLEQRGIPSEKTGFLVSAFFFATTLARPVSGRLTERLGARRTVLMSALLATGGSMILTLAGTSLPLIFLCRIVTGFGFGSMVVALATLQNLVVPDEIRGSAFSWTAVGSVAPLFTVIPLGEYLIHTEHYGLYLWMAPVLSLLAAWMTRALPSDRDRFTPGEMPSGSWRELLSTPGMKTLLTCSFLFAVPDGTLVYIVNLTDSLGLVGSFFMVPVSVSALVTRAFGRRIPDLIPRIWLPAPCFALMATALFGTTLAGSNDQLILWGSLFGLGMGLGFPVLFSLTGDLLPPRLRARGTAAVYLIMDFCWMGVPLVMGFCKPILGLPFTFRCMSTLSIGSALWVQWMWNRTVREAKTSPSRC